MLYSAPMKLGEQFYRNLLLVSAFAMTLAAGNMVRDILSINPRDLESAPDIDSDFTTFILTVSATILSTWAYTTAREEK